MTDHELDKIFSDQLQNLESPVNPEIWTRVSNSITQAGTSTTAAATSGISKIAIGIAATVVTGSIAAAIFFYSTKNNENKQAEQVISIPTVSAENKEASTNGAPQTDITTPGTTQIKQDLSINTTAAQPAQLQQNVTDATNPALTNETGGNVDGTTNSQTSTQTYIPSTEVNNPDPNQASKSDVGTNKPNDALVSTSQPSESEKAIPSVPTDDVAQYLDLEHISNVLTPNGDGMNEEFLVNVNNMKIVNMVIYDRNGKTIKSVQNSTKELIWDGKDKNGNTVATGTYFYFIFGETIHSSPLVHRGSIDIR